MARLLHLCFVACAGLGWAAGASAADDEVHGTLYSGTIGQQSITLELDPVADKQVNGRYFYARHHGDLLLGGTSNDPDHLHLLEGKDPDDTTSPRLDLIRQRDGGWKGTWQAPGGKPLAVTLHIAGAPVVAADAVPYLRQLAHEDPYASTRLAGLGLQRGKRQQFMGHALQWWRQPESKIELFQILDGYPAARRQRINNVLMDRLWSEVSAYYDCMSTAGPYGGDYTQTVTPRLLSASIVSVSVFTEYDCGGAHPDFGDGPINLDARDARTLALEDVLWIGKGKPFRYTGDLEPDPAQPPEAAGAGVDFDTFSDYREKVLAPWLAGRLARLYPKQTAGDGDDECGYADAFVWQYPAWYLTPAGIFIHPSFPRAARACEADDDWSLLPYSEVRKHPGGVALQLP